MQALDKLDRHILRNLQIDGRATYDQIADAVGLSPSAVLRRVKRLEAAGVIDRYVALIAKLGLRKYLPPLHAKRLSQMPSSGVLRFQRP